MPTPRPGLRLTFKGSSGLCRQKSEFCIGNQQSLPEGIQHAKTWQKSRTWQKWGAGRGSVPGGKLDSGQEVSLERWEPGYEGPRMPSDGSYPSSCRQRRISNWFSDRATAPDDLFRKIILASQWRLLEGKKEDETGKLVQKMLRRFRWVWRRPALL